MILGQVLPVIFWVTAPHAAIAAKDACSPEADNDCSSHGDSSALDPESDAIQVSMLQKASRGGVISKTSSNEEAILIERREQLVAEIRKIDEELQAVDEEGMEEVSEEEEAADDEDTEEFNAEEEAAEEEGDKEAERDARRWQRRRRYSSWGPAPWKPASPSLKQPSNGKTFTFYMYRAQSDENYGFANANAASLGGVLWYLQNEVVNRCDSGRGGGERGYRRFKVTRILRYKVTYKAPQPLLDAGMNFGTRVAFDKGKNTGSWYPDLDKVKQYDKYGYNIGCNYLGDGPYPQCPCRKGDRMCPTEGYCEKGKHGKDAIVYPEPIWYSLPGACPTEEFHKWTDKCKRAQPGGLCNKPNGNGTCTFTFEEAGEINLDELVGIKEKFGTHTNFCNHHCVEYVKYGGWKDKDKGKCGINFFDGRHDLEKCKAREKAVDDFFKKKYPNMPTDAQLPPPPCDFDPKKFYSGNVDLAPPRWQHMEYPQYMR